MSRVARMAVQNVNLSWRRSLPLIALMLFASVVGLVAGPGSLDDHLHAEASRRESGSNIIVARSSRGLPAAACERLGGATGVVNAGALREIDVLDVRPGIAAPTGSVTAGMRALLVDGSDRGGALLGTTLATRLLVTEDGSADTVIPDRGTRSAPFDGWRLWSMPASGDVGQCWAEFTDAGFASGSDTVAAALLLSTPDLEVATLAFDGGPRPFGSLTTLLAPLAVGSLLGLAGFVYIRFRRIDLAMYRLLGFSESRARAALAWEIGLTTAGAMTMATCGWLVFVMAGAVPRAVLTLTVGHLMLSGLVAATIVGVALRLASRGANQLAVLREGG